MTARTVLRGGGVAGARGAATTGWQTLVRHQVRRDRWLFLWWCLGAVLLFWSQAVSVAGLYTSQAEFDRAAAVMGDNPAFLALAGPARSLNSVGGQVFWQSAALGAVVVGLMSMFLIGRHTRAEEESGRDDLVRSTAIGRHAPLAAALATALLANVVVGALVAVSLWAVQPVDAPLQGLPLPLVDSVATGVGLAACGWVFSGTALVAAQLTHSTRAMYAVAGAAIGVAYALRAIGDVGGSVLSWLSPIGWYQAMAAYHDVTWWPVGLMVGVAAVLTFTAYALFDRRDVGAGLWAARPGPADAAPSLGSGIGLTWRLQKGAVLGWTVGLLLTGLSYGSIGDSVEALLGDSDVVAAMGAGAAGNLVEGFYATSAVTLGLIVSAFAISSAGRPRAEEDAGHAEPLLGTGLSRSAWLGGHVLVTVGGTVVALVVAAAGMALGYALTTGDPGEGVRLSLPTLTYVAPVLVLSGVARLLYGLAPRLLVLAWLPLAFAVVVLILGETLRMPQWVQDLSPFEHLALAPAEELRWVPVLVVGAVAVVLSVAGQLAFRRRDVTGR